MAQNVYFLRIKFRKWTLGNLWRAAKNDVGRRWSIQFERLLWRKLTLRTEISGAVVATQNRRPNLKYQVLKPTFFFVY